MQGNNILVSVLEFIYTGAHWLGINIIALVARLLPNVDLQILADPIGYLALITILLLIAQFAKKVAWIIVAVGWGLIIIRVLLIAFHIDH